MKKRLRRLLAFGTLALAAGFCAVYGTAQMLSSEQARTTGKATPLLFAKETDARTRKIDFISTRRVCSAAIERRGPYVFNVNPDDVEVRLYTSDETPAKVLPASRTMLRDLMNEGQLRVDLSEVADGEYHLLLCHKKHDCRLPRNWQKPHYIQTLLQSYRSELQREYDRQESIGFRSYSVSFANDSYAFRTLRQELLTESPGVLGGVPSLSVRARSVVQPRASILVRPHRLTEDRSSASPAFESQPSSVAPQLIVAWQMEDLRSSRHLAQAPSPDGCYETASFLTVDLQGHGLKLGSVLDGQYQNLYHDGTMQKVAWPQPQQNAFLAWHDSASGIVAPIDRLAALRAWDSDANGLLDQRDQIPAGLGLWQDLNQDGSLTPDEWRAFADVILSIDLRISRTYQEDHAGNRVEALAQIRMLNGSIRAVAELYPRHF